MKTLTLLCTLLLGWVQAYNVQNQPNAVLITPAAPITLCNSGNPTTLNPIILSEQSSSSFTIGKGTLVLGFDNPNFIIASLPTVTVTGATGDFDTPTISLINNQLHLNYNFTDTTKTTSIVFSNWQVSTKPNTTPTTTYLKPIQGYQHFTGLTSQAILATIHSIKSTTTTTINPPTNINGASTVCIGGNNFTYTAQPTPNATGYLWTLPPNFLATINSSTTQINPNQYHTITNAITLNIAGSANPTNATLEVASTNDCYSSHMTTTKTIKVAPPPNPKVSLPANTFPDNDLSPINISVTNNPAGGTGTLRGDGVVGNKLYPGLLMPATGYKVYYDYTINNCTTTTSTTFSVYDADAVILGLASTYCSDLSTPQTVTITNVSSMLGAKLYSPANQSIPLNLQAINTNNYRYSFTSQDLFQTYGAGEYRFEIHQTNANQPIAITFQIITPPNQTILSTSSKACANGTNIYNYSSSIPAANDNFTWSVPSGDAIFIGDIKNQPTISLMWANGSPTGTTKILRLTQTRNGCTTVIDHPIQVFSLPQPNIIGELEPCPNQTLTYTVNQASQGYNWQVEGGQIIGNNNQNNITIKWGNTNGSIQITQSLNGCLTSTTAKVTIETPPTITITGLSLTNEYCVADTTPTILTPLFNGGLPPNDYLTTGKFEIKRIAGNKPASTSFVSLVEQGVLTNRWLPAFPIQANESPIPTNAKTNQLNLNAGNYLIRYAYTNANGCINYSSTHHITIKPLPTLSFTGLSANYCRNDSPTALSAFKNGVLTPLLPSFKAQNLTTGILTPLQGNWLNPAELVPGKYELFIDFAGNPTDCPNTSKRDTSIYFKITATPSNLKVIAERDYNSKTMRFSIAPNSTVTQQQWNFGNWLTTSPTVQYPINPNNQGNMPLLNYALIATNASGCSQQINHTFKIDFDYQGQYIHQTKPTRFTNNSSIIGDSTYSYLWHFGDGTTSTVQNPTHHYQKPDTYKVSLTIQTPTATYTLHRNIDIFPLVKIQTNKPYYTNAQNWITHGTVADSIQKTSWQIHNNIWQMPQGYANQEQSCIESPTFDIGNLTYPMLSFDYQLNTQAEADGVAFLYTLDDGKTWQRLGELGQGIAWYNTKPILGKPGNRFTQTNSDAQGWSGSSNGWQTAHIALDRTIANLSNNPIIRFRLAFGSNADNPPSSQYKGFAFRNFQLRNRNRVALLEHFTNQGIPNAPQKSANLHQIISSSHEITSIHYHTNFPAIDQLNLQNPKDPSARALHYGLPNVPANVANGKPKDSLSILQLKDTLLKQTLLPALFAINIKKLKWQNNQLQSQVELVALQDLNQPIVLHAAIVDSTQSTTNGQVYPQTLRKMLPDAAGIFKNKAWKQGEAQTTTFYWNPSQPIINTTKSKLLVFIADYSTRKIYQATTQKIPTYTKHNGEQTTITSMPLSPTQAPQPLAYPNPTNEELTLNLPMSLNPSPNIRWQIINSLGKPVKQGHWASRTHQHQIYSGDLPVGAYLIKIYDAKNPRQSFKIKIKKIR